MFRQFVIVCVMSSQANFKRPTNVAAFTTIAHTLSMRSPLTMDTPTLNGTLLAIATVTMRKSDVVQVCKFDR